MKNSKQIILGLVIGAIIGAVAYHFYMTAQEKKQAAAKAKTS